MPGAVDGCSKLKRGMADSELNILTSHVPMKHCKSLAEEESGSDRKRKMAEQMKKMSVKERCLMVERVIYAEEDFMELPVEYQVMWEFLEEAAEPERQTLLARRAGSSSKCGGGWPSTAVETL